MTTPISLFDYDLPEQRIAQSPAEPRDSSRLLCLDRLSGEVRDRHFQDLVDVLREGDVLVLNNTKVFKARLRAHVERTGTKIEVFLLKQRGKDWEVLLAPGRRVQVGDVLVFAKGLTAEKVGADLDAWTSYIRFRRTAKEVIQFANQHGDVPLPPYIENKTQLDRYQTVYAEKTGSVAAPTAGLHFTPDLLKTLKQKGVIVTYVTLHVGLGTFQDVKTTTLEEHTMHAEVVEVTPEAAEVINQAKKDGRRVIAVGTTTTRTLEGVAKNGRVKQYRGEVDVFITPGFSFQIIDGLLTNFHLPKSTLLALVCAFAGREHVFAAYRHAIKEQYRFYSFGDAMFIL